MKIYQSNTYKKDLSWLYFEVEPRIKVQEKQQVKDQQSYTLVLVAFLTIQSSNYEQHPRHNNNIPHKAVW